MSTRGRVAAVALAAAAIVAGSLIASNAGFTIVRSLKAADGGVQSLSGINMLALPYRTRNNLTLASELFNDIGADNVVSIGRFDRSTGTFVLYYPGQPDFSLVPGEGYRVRVSQDVSYRIYGSHDPEVIVPLLSQSNPASVSGDNWIALPYHSTATTARELFLEIGNAVQVVRWNAATDQTQVYANAATPDFPLQKGEAYSVTVGSDTAFVPTHY